MDYFPVWFGGLVELYPAHGLFLVWFAGLVELYPAHGLFSCLVCRTC